MEYDCQSHDHTSHDGPHEKSLLITQPHMIITSPQLYYHQTTIYYKSITTCNRNKRITTCNHNKCKRKHKCKRTTTYDHSKYKHTTMRCHNNRSTIFHNNKYITLRGLTRITQTVWSQKTVIDYIEGPANLGLQRVLYTSCQRSSLLPANLVIACRALSATPLLLSKPLVMPGPGSVCAPSSPANVLIQWSALARISTRRLSQLRLGAVQVTSKVSPRHNNYIQ
jgi:hypothetical protein